MARAAVFPFRSLMIVGVLLAGACGGSSPSAVEPIPQSTAVVVEQAGSPLVERLGFSSDQNVRQRELVALQAQADSEVVVCMAAAGFQYIPQSVWAPVLSGDAATDGSREWAERNGLGIARAFESARHTIDLGPGDDPNALYLASLGADQAATYRSTLIGVLPQGAADNAAYEPGGCQGTAFETLFAKYSVLEAFLPELDSMNERIRSDPRVQSFMADWSVCMTARSFDYSDQEDMRGDVYARLFSVDGFTDESLAVDSATGDLGELLDFERSVAIADHDCSRAFQGALAEIRITYEREFIIDYRGRLDAVAPED